MATTKGTRSYDREAPSRPKIAVYGTPAYTEWVMKKAEELAKRGKLPYTASKPKPVYRDMVSKNGSSFQIRTDLTYLDDHEPEDWFIHSVVLSSDIAERLFNHGNMEAARKILWKSLTPRFKECKKTKQKWQNIITPACFSLLSDIVAHLSGEHARFRACWNQPEPTQCEVVRVEQPEVMVVRSSDVGVSPQLAEMLIVEKPQIELQPQEIVEDLQMQLVEEQEDEMQLVETQEDLPSQPEQTLEEILQELADLPYEQKQYKVEMKSVHAFFLKMAQEALSGKYFTVTAYQDAPKMQEQMDGAQSNDLETTSSVEATKNLTFVDERPVDDTALYTTSSASTNDVNNDIAENQWSLKSIMTREYPLLDFEWKVTAPTSTPIINVGIPKIITDNVNCMITRQLAFFSFLRAGVKIRIQLNGTKFHCGRLICYFKPLTWNDDLEDNLAGVTCYPHTFLDASVSNSGVIEIPFSHLLSHFSQESGTLYNDSLNTLGSLVIRPYNKLNAAEKSSQSLYGQVYASLINPEVHLPTSVINKFSYGTGYMQGLESVLKKSAGKAINSGLGIADKLTGGLVTGAGDAICNLLGIRDKPLDPIAEEPILNRTVAPLCHGAGLDRSVRLALSPASQTDSDAAVMGATNCDFNILTLCKMPSLLTTVQWKDIQTPRTKLYDMLVTPVYINSSFYSNDGTQRIANYSPTMLAYVSRAFCLWRGDLKIKIQVVATQFHSGRLAFVYDPHGTTDFNKIDFENNKSHNVIIMDVQEKQELEIDLPYFAVKPWLRCNRFRGETNMSATYGNSAFLDCDISGIFRIYILNPLVRPDNVPNAVDVNIFFYAGNNFELSIPSPVAPLSVRRGPTGIQYANSPRYPWCTKAQNKVSKYFTEIMTMYDQGRRLIDRKFLTKGDKWYTATIKVYSADTLVFADWSSKLRNFIEKKIDQNTIDLINSLENYSESGYLPKIEATTEQTCNLVKQQDPKINLLDGRLVTVINSQHQMKNRLNDIAQNTITLLQGQQAAKIDLNSIQQTANTIDSRLQSTYSRLNEVDTTTVRTLGFVEDIPRVNVEYDHKADFNTQGHFTISKVKKMQEQGVESYTTTRDNEGAAITITAGNSSSEVAPTTVSENAMNLQTVLRRYYPLFVSGEIKNTIDFTLITIPVSPSFTPNDESTTIVSDVSRQYEVNNLAWFSRLYTYWRGSLRYKVLTTTPGSDIYVWHDPMDARDFEITSGFTYEHLTQQLSFAAVTASTGVQQGIEIETPFYSGFNQLCHSHVSNKTDLRAQVGCLKIAVRNTLSPLTLSIFISTGDDFMFNVLRAPPVVHEPCQYAYTDGDDDYIKYPEFYHNLTHKSITHQIPGSLVFNAKSSGAFGLCPLPPAPMNEQMFKSMTGIDKLEQTVDFAVNEYEETVRPTIEKANNTLQQINDFTNEIRDDVLPAVLGHAKLFHRDLNETHDTIKEFLPRVQESMEHLNATTINARNTMESIKYAATQVGDAGFYMAGMMKTMTISGLWLNLVALYKKFTYTNLVNIILIASSLFKQEATQIVQYIWKQMNNLYEGFRPKATNGAMTEQAFTELIAEHKEEVHIGLAAIATIIYCAMFGELPGWSKIKQCIKTCVTGKTMKEQSATNDFLKSIHFNNLGFKALDNAYNFFHDKIDKILNWFMGTECRDVQLQKAFEEKSKEIEEWIDAIAELDDEDLMHQALIDLDIHNRYYRLVDQGKEFTKWLMNEGVSKNVSAIIRDSNKRLMDIVKRLQNIRPGHGFRYAPFVVAIHGETSTGKSNMMHLITDQIRQELDIPYYNSVYAVPSSDKYLSGYEGQAIVEWDDHLQNTEQDNMVGEFVQWASNADVRVNMADLEHKGALFTSKAIVMTTNAAYARLNTIRDNTAYLRRRNIVIGVQFAPGWDLNRMYNTPFDPDFTHAVFSICDPVREDHLIQHNLNWQQVKDYVSLEHQQWMNKQNAMVEEYFATRPSLRIPRGVRIVEQPEGDIEAIADHLEEFQDAVEEPMTEQGEATIEQLDAEQFVLEFGAQSDEVKKSYLNQFKRTVQKVIRKTRSYMQILKEKFKIQIKKLTDYAKEFYEKHPNIATTIAIVTGILSVGALVKGILSMTGDIFQMEGAYDSNPKPGVKIVTAEGAYDTQPRQGKPIVTAEGAYDTNPKNVVRIVRAEGASKLKISEQGCDDPSAVMMGRTSVYPLLAALQWEQADCMQMQGLAIGGKVMLIPHHFFRKAKGGEFFYITRGNVKTLVEYVPERLYRIRDKDACLYFLGSQVDSRKKILHYFLPEQLLGKISKSVPAVLVGMMGNGTMLEKACVAKGNQYISYTGDEGEVTYSQTGWQYQINTLAGECGSILIACTNQLPAPSKIIGMHTAGYADRIGGFSVILTREMIEETLGYLESKFGKQVIGCGVPPQVNQDEKLFNEQCKVIPDGKFSYYGVMDSKYCPSQPQKTQLEPTPFQGKLYPVEKAPAVLKPTKDLQPLAKALTKYGQDTRPFAQRDIKIVQASILNDLMTLDSDLDYGPTDLETAVFGQSGVKYCEHLNFKSSPGWPYQCMPEAKGQRGKEFMFDAVARKIVYQPLIDAINERETKATVGERVPSIWRDCLKDELRPLAKVKEGKTRLFTIAPVDFTILTRKYFLAFEQAFYKGHSTFFSAVGINPESFEWTTAYNRLRSYGTDCCAGDFSTYDGTLMADLMAVVCDLIDDWYKLKGEKDPNASLVRRVLFDEMIHTYQLEQNCVYKTHQGNPSGNPLTVIINTIINAFYMRLTWMEIMRAENYVFATMDAYKQNVMEEMYGDDNRLVIKRKVQQWFNQQNITQYLAKHGITYTDELKTGNIQFLKPLLETSFLKRGYRVDKEIGKDIVLPVMARETITSLTNWMRTNLCPEDQLQANMRSALGFAFFHGREFYDEFNLKFQQAMYENNMMPLCITYDELLDLFLNDIHNDTTCFSSAMDINFTEGFSSRTSV